MKKLEQATAEGQIIFTNDYLSFIDPETGRVIERWIEYYPDGSIKSEETNIT